MFKQSQKVNKDGTAVIVFACSELERNLFETEVFGDMQLLAEDYYSGWDYTNTGFQVYLDFTDLDLDAEELAEEQGRVMYDVINEVINETPVFQQLTFNLHVEQEDSSTSGYDLGSIVVSVNQVESEDDYAELANDAVGVDAWSHISVTNIRNTDLMFPKDHSCKTIEK